MLVPDELYQDLLAKGYKEQALMGDPGDQVCKPVSYTHLTLPTKA